MTFSGPVTSPVKSAIHACLFTPGGGCPGHQCPMPEVSSQTCCTHELPVHHAKGRGKSGATGVPLALLVQRMAWQLRSLLGLSSEHR